MVIIKTEEEIKHLREGGRILARILRAVADRAVPGVTTESLDYFARESIEASGARPAFLGYRPSGSRKPFPASLCVSVNDEVVHGIPGDYVLKEGDVVSLDLGIEYRKVFLDHAVSLVVGTGTKRARILVETAKRALEAGIGAIVFGGHVGDIGHAIEKLVLNAGFGIVRTLAGHGVGRAIHEDPYVPNYGRPGVGERLVSGMVIAIEPMITIGGEDVFTASDGYTIKTSDGSLAAHFEHTVLISPEGPEILTKN